MPIRPTQIELGDAVSGMILTDSVLDTRGNILLPAGVALTDAMIASLGRHEIDTIVIAGAMLSSAEENGERDARVARLNYLFRPPGKVADATSGPAAHLAPPTPVATDVLHRYLMNFRLEASL